MNIELVESIVMAIYIAFWIISGTISIGLFIGEIAKRIFTKDGKKKKKTIEEKKPKCE